MVNINIELDYDYSIWREIGTRYIYWLDLIYQMRASIFFQKILAKSLAPNFIEVIITIVAEIKILTRPNLILLVCGSKQTIFVPIIIATSQIFRLVTHYSRVKIFSGEHSAKLCVPSGMFQKVLSPVKKRQISILVH